MKSSIASPALAELQQSAKFYTEKGGTGLGVAFINEFERIAALIIANPEAGTIFQEKYRTYPFRRFPYNIFYYVTDNADLRILAVAHQRRRPGYWVNRN